MSNNAGKSIGFVAGGATVGAGFSATVGGIGIVGGFGGIGLGMGAITGVGAIAGAATYGVFQAINEGDTTAFNYLGIGVISGVSLSSTIGGVGVGIGGTAFGVGMGSMAMAGGILGLGIYGLAKMFISSGNKEPIAQIFARIDNKISYQDAYNQAMIELNPFLAELNWQQKFSELEMEEELKLLKVTLEFESNTHTAQKLNFEDNMNKSQPLNFEETQITIEANLAWKCLYTVKEHTASINGITISPDNQIIASGSDDKTVRLWNLKTGKLLYTFFGQGAEVQAVTISPDGKMLIAAGFDQRITAWNLDNKNIFCAFFGRNTHYSHFGAIFSVVFSPDRKYLISASGDKTIRIWNSYTGKLKLTLNGHLGTVWCLAISPDGQTLVSGSDDKTIRIWNLNSYQLPRSLKGHLSGVTAVAISPDGNVLMSGSMDGIIKQWNLLTEELIQTLPGHTNAVLSIAINPDGKTFASATTKDIKIWHLTTGELLQTLSGCHPLKFSFDGQTLVTGSEGGRIKIWHQVLGENQSIVDPDLFKTWWEVLGVTKNTQPDEVKKVYRRLARQYHPDVNQSKNTILTMQIINQAYEQFLKQFSQNLM